MGDDTTAGKHSPGKEPVENVMLAGTSIGHPSALQ